MMGMDVTQVAVVLGILTLAFWIAGGVIAVLGINSELWRSGSGRLSEFLAAGLTGAGMVSVFAMAMFLLLP
ncbi:hypothetical protein [Rhizobium grahamii]|uniref:Transmembrane protein n=2 Tax=Rhizobium grahamii TaxID=1120045 RepID=S3IB26_9HYPH|nr:hypothetical protein [Rhizobium grahamii]EPE96458.1 hypothetical protein RGCCGE502_19950 [Rhizobium grahamii CCGE 502]RDJ03252.1 hypothetical protein B5K06_30095 [Rhizobium grahamii]